MPKLRIFLCREPQHIILSPKQQYMPCIYKAYVFVYNVKKPQALFFYLVKVKFSLTKQRFCHLKHQIYNSRNQTNNSNKVHSLRRVTNPSQTEQQHKREELGNKQKLVKSRNSLFKVQRPIRERDHKSVTNSRYPPSVGDRKDMDSKFMKQITSTSMKPNDLVAFLLEIEGLASGKPKGTICCWLISLERKHGKYRGVTPKDSIECAIYFRDVFTWIVKLKLQPKQPKPN